MLTFTFAGDEAGDPSFSFGKGATRYFVIAVIGLDQPDQLREKLNNLRIHLNLSAGFEFKFNSLSSAQLRNQVFDMLAQSDFEAWAVIVDKTLLPDTFRVMKPLEFYLYFVTEAIKLIPQKKREGATIILDEFGKADQISLEFRRFLTARSIPRLFRKIVAKRSKSESLIQIADLIAGSILRRDAKSDDDTYSKIEGKLRQIVQFRP
ncbi:MAG: DUF3800 domain-containing protein [Anaerolineae bacterium]|nr:DUF3800 domain-containing protein [Anaerolineae bacterium]